MKFQVKRVAGTLYLFCLCTMLIFYEVHQSKLCKDILCTAFYVTSGRMGQFLVDVLFLDLLKQAVHCAMIGSEYTVFELTIAVEVTSFTHCSKRVPLHDRLTSI